MVGWGSAGGWFCLILSLQTRPSSLGSLLTWPECASSSMCTCVCNMHMCVPYCLAVPSHRDGQDLLCYIPHSLWGKQYFFCRWTENVHSCLDNIKCTFYLPLPPLPFHWKLLLECLLPQKKMMAFILSRGDVMCNHHGLSKWVCVGSNAGAGHQHFSGIGSASLIS